MDTQNTSRQLRYLEEVGAVKIYAQNCLQAPAE